MKIIAVEKGLTSVSQYLTEQGCHVVAMTNDSTSQSGAAVLVVSGSDKNMMGIQSVKQNVPVISVAGLTPEEVYHRVQTHIQK